MDDASTRPESGAGERDDGETKRDDGETKRDDGETKRDDGEAEPADREAEREYGGTGREDGDADRDGGDAELAALRERVDAEYDFEDFGPSDMARMSADEWDVAFDPESWITGEALLDRAEAELKGRIARREVFGILERVREDGRERVLVYSDEGYAIVDPSGKVTGRGTVLRDVEPVVALAAMEEYDVPEPPDDWSLPHPDTVPQGSGEFGNLMLQVVAGVQLLAGVVLVGGSLFLGVETIVAPALGLLFLLVGVFLFAMVANARLSDRFRAEEYRERLRALRAAEERPDFVPVGGAVVTEEDEEP